MKMLGKLMLVILIFAGFGLSLYLAQHISVVQNPLLNMMLIIGTHPVILAIIYFSGKKKLWPTIEQEEPLTFANHPLA